MSDGVGRAGFDTVAAKNAARVIDVVNARISFAGGDSLSFCIFSGFDVNTSCGAGGGTEEAADALFQTIFVAVKNVDPAVARLEMDGLFWVIFRDRFPQHIAECHTETLDEGKKCFACLLNDRRHRV